MYVKKLDITSFLVLFEIITGMISPQTELKAT